MGVRVGGEGAVSSDTTRTATNALICKAAKESSADSSLAA